jgi:hypothetical protein
MKSGSEVGPHEIVLGQVLDGDKPSIFRLTPGDQAHHATFWGRTGSGKSKLLQSIFLQHVSKNHGVCIIEPHHDLSLDTLSYLVDLGYFSRPDAFERLVYLDWGNGSFVPFNVLADRRPPETVALHTLEAMMRVWPELRRAPTFQTVWLSAMIVLIENGLPLTYLYQLLTDGPFRERCLRKIQDPLIRQSFGTYERTKGSVKDAGSTLRRAFLISFHQVTRLTLGQPDLGLNLRRMMDQCTCLIVNLGNIQDSETRRLIGALLLVQIEQAALSRTDLSPERRRPWTVLVDEWPSFAASDATIGTILAQTRKYGLRLYLAAQSTGQVSSERLRGALENCRLNVVFGLGRDSAVDQSRRIATLDPLAVRPDPVTGRLHKISSGEQFEDLAQDLQTFSPQEAYVKLHDRSPVKVRTLSVRDVQPGRVALEEVFDTYRRRFQRSKDDAEAACRDAMPLPEPTREQARPFVLFGAEDEADDDLAEVGF